MRQLLLDTHVALWALATPTRLAAPVRTLLEDPHTTVWISSVSVWEVEIKRAIGKLTAPDGFAERCRSVGFEPLDITFEHAELATRLPAHHHDPFDRMLIAQAIATGSDLVSDDRAIARYDVRVLRATA